MKSPETEQACAPQVADPLEMILRPNPFSQRLFFISMGIAAAPVLIAGGIMLQARIGLPPQHPQAMSARRAIARSIVPPLDAKQEPGTVGKAGAPGGELAVASGNTQTPQISFSDLHVGDPRVDIQLPGVESTSGNSRKLSDQPTSLKFGMVRLEIQPPEGDIFARDVLLSAVSTPMPPLSQEQEASVNDSDTGSHAAITTTGHTKGIHLEIKGHGIAHHHHRRQKHAPPSLLAKIGRSVKEAFTSVLTLPRTAKERFSWD